MSGSNSDNSGLAASPAPQVINFNQIPANWEVPGTFVEFNPNYSQSGLQAYAAKMLIIAQMLHTGQAVPNTVYPVYAKGQGATLFGMNSIAATMADAFIAANPFTQLDMIGISGASSAVQATNVMTIGGTATAAGTLALYLQGIRIPVTVNAGDTAAVVGPNALAAILATAGLQVSTTAVAAVLTLTALHGGTLGNSLDARVNYQPGDMLPPGLTVTFAPGVTGATDPSIATALSTVATSKYSDIVTCFTDANNVGLLEAELVRRYGPMVKLNSHAYGALAMTYGQALANQATLNCKYRSVLPVQNPPQPPWIWAAVVAGVAAFNLANDPSRQLRNLALPGLLAPALADRFDKFTRNLLIQNGMSTFKVLVDGTVVLEKMVTENVQNSAGVPDKSYHDIMAPKVETRISIDFEQYIDSVYPRNKLSDDGTIASEYDPTVVTPRRLKASWAGRSLLYERLGWIEGSQVTAAQSVFVRDLTDHNRVDSRLQYRRIGNLMVVAVSLEFQV